MTEKERGGIAFLALAFYTLLISQGLGPGIWLGLAMAVSWISFAIGFVAFFSAPKKDE